MYCYVEFDDQMLYDDVTVTKRKDGRYMCREIVGKVVDEQTGKVIKTDWKYFYADNKVKAKKLRAEFIIEQVKQQKENREYNESFVKALEDWLTHHKKRKVRSSSYDRLENTLFYQLLPAIQGLGFEKLALKNVTTQHIEEIMDFNLKKGYSYSTLLKVKNYLCAFFDFHDGDVPKNPMKKYQFYSKESVRAVQESLWDEKKKVMQKLEQRKKQKKAKKQKDEEEIPIVLTEEEMTLSRISLNSQLDQQDIHVLTQDEVVRIRNVIQNGYTKMYHSRSGNLVESARYYPYQGEFILFMLNTGIRLGEAVALQYSDVDFENGEITITKNAINPKERDENGDSTGKRIHELSSTKTRTSKATIAISPFALDILCEMKAKEKPDYNSFIVHNEEGTRIERRVLERRFERILEGAKIETKGIHCLRHTYGTQLYEKTQDMQLVAHQLRHSDPAFTSRTYVHKSNERAADQIKNIRI